MTVAGVVKEVSEYETSLVVSAMETDRPGLVETLSKALAAHDGNWLESRTAVLGRHIR